MCKFLHKLHLDLLDLQKSLPLIHEKMINLFMEVTNLQFCLKIDPIIMFGLQTVPGLLAILTHHNDGSLNGGET